MLTLIQNDQQVPSGNFLDWLRTLDLPVRIIEAYLGEELPSVDDSSAVIVLGGAMGVHDSSRYPYLLTVKSYIQQVVLREVPLLGICLGGQLLADVLGATVHSRKNGEMGLLSVTVLSLPFLIPCFTKYPSLSLPSNGIMIALKSPQEQSVLPHPLTVLIRPSVMEPISTGSNFIRRFPETLSLAGLIVPLISRTLHGLLTTLFGTKPYIARFLAKFLKTFFE